MEETSKHIEKNKIDSFINELSKKVSSDTKNERVYKVDDNKNWIDKIIQ